jgi:hypothetical protein
LHDREGWQFASLGLTESDDPAIALADLNGIVRFAWVQRQTEFSLEQDWWDMAVFDKTGRLRVSLELHPNEVPSLIIYPEAPGFQYFADFSSRKLAALNEQSQSTVSWLSVMRGHPARPVRLLDNRKKVLWKAP